MKRFAKQTLKHWIKVILHTEDSPERTSLAFAVGVFISFLPPVPYFHTLFAIFVAFIFRLNRLAVVIGSYVNTPFTMAPLLFAEVSLGLACFGGGDAPDITWRQLSRWQGWKDAAIELQPLLAPLMLGCLILGLTAAVMAYFVALTLITRYRRGLALVGRDPKPGDEETASGGHPTPLITAAGGGLSTRPGVRGPAVETPENPS